MGDFSLRGTVGLQLTLEVVCSMSLKNPQCFFDAEKTIVCGEVKKMSLLDPFCGELFSLCPLARIEISAQFV